MRSTLSPQTTLEQAEKVAGSPTERATLPSFVRGFDEAHARLSAAISKAETPADDVFLPLFEALNWAIVLDDLARKSPNVSIAAEEDDLQGLRFARNRAQHQWANAVELRDITSPPAPIVGGRSRRGATVRMTRPTSVWAWVWVDETQLPPPTIRSTTIQIRRPATRAACRASRRTRSWIVCPGLSLRCADRAAHSTTACLRRGQHDIAAPNSTSASRRDARWAECFVVVTDDHPLQDRR